MEKSDLPVIPSEPSDLEEPQTAPDGGRRKLPRGALVMLKKLRSRLTYANAMSTIACFVALGGSAYAVNTIGSADIINESILSADIKNGEVRNDDLAASAITSAKIYNGSVLNSDIGLDAVTSNKVAANTLTGADISESTLGTVPSAYTVPDGSIDSAKIANGSVTAADTAPMEHWRYIGDAGQPGFQNGWSNYDAATAHNQARFQHVAYAKDNDGIVHLAGLLKGGTPGRTMFTLPGAYCPWYFKVLPVLSNNALARVTIGWLNTSNDCIVYADFGSNEWISLDGITFRSWQQDHALGSVASAGTSAGEVGRPSRPPEPMKP